MQLRLVLLVYCQFCVGIFAHTQVKSGSKSAAKILTGADAIPITVLAQKKQY